MLHQFQTDQAIDILDGLSISATPRLITSEGFFIARLTPRDTLAYEDMVNKMTALKHEFKFVLPHATDIAIMPPIGSSLQPVLINQSDA